MATDNSSVRYRNLDFLGFPGYRVGDDGSVWTCLNNRWGVSNKWRELKQSPTNGYLYVHLNRGSAVSRVIKPVHRLVLIAFVGQCPPRMECCHNDGNRANNRLSNLRWDTRVGNNADRVIHTGGQYGEQNPSHKLTATDVAAIRAEYAAGGVRQKDIAAKYGVNRRTVGVIVRRGSWKHLG